MAPTLTLGEPADALHLRLNEGMPAAGLPTQHHRRKTTRDTAVLLSREPLAMPLLPFMHNVLAKRRAGGASA